MSALIFTARQALLVGFAVLGYFGVRGLTEGNIEGANRNAEQILRLERLVGLDLELWLQEQILANEVLVDVANWIYIWGHWPVVVATLVYLAVTRRDSYLELRNALFLSGAIGLVIYASYAVSPPRLFDAGYIDTVTENSVSYRFLQPPALVNKYAAIPSLHFGWNLLVGLMWWKVWPGPVGRVAGVLMPMAMAFAVVATANHWALDVVAGAAVALSGLALERARRRKWNGPDGSAGHGPAGDRVIDITDGDRVDGETHTAGSGIAAGDDRLDREGIGTGRTGLTDDHITVQGGTGAGGVSRPRIKGAGDTRCSTKHRSRLQR